MTISEIYNTYTAGSDGFIVAVETFCGFEITRSEIARIADMAVNAEDFEEIWSESDEWTDENN